MGGPMSHRRGIPILLLLVLVGGACSRLQGKLAYQPPLVPIRFVVDTHGHVRVEARKDLPKVTPIGVFSVNVGATLLARPADEPDFVVIIRDLRHHPEQSSDRAYSVAANSEFDAVVVGAALISQRKRAVMVDVSAGSVTVVTLYEKGTVRSGTVPSIAFARGTAPPSVDDAGSPVEYEAMNAVDGEASTAWRVAGNGEGQWIQVNFPPGTRLSRVGVIPGYAKRDPKTGRDRFGENRRIRTARLVFDGERTLHLRFRDDRAIRWIPVDVVTTSMRLYVGETTTHGGRDFTAISELVGYY